MIPRDRNQWPVKCQHCDKTVEPGAGYVSGRPGAWVGSHHDCIPVYKENPK